MIRLKSFLICILAYSSAVYSQIPQTSTYSNLVAQDEKTPKPVQWVVSFNTKEAKVGDEIELILKGKIAPHQHMYANDFKCDPTAYTLVFSKNSIIWSGYLPSKYSKTNEFFEKK